MLAACITSYISTVGGQTYSYDLGIGVNRYKKAARTRFITCLEEANKFDR